jgi:anti-anti-sigma regulatory factor
MLDNLGITKTEGRITILHFDGYLDNQTENLALENARAVIDAGGRFLLIDLTNLDMITSAGLHALHDIYKMFTPPEEAENWKNQNTTEVYKSPYIKLAGASDQIQYVLNITGFLESISIYSTVQEALVSFPS